MAPANASGVSYILLEIGLSDVDLLALFLGTSDAGMLLRVK